MGSTYSPPRGLFLATNEDFDMAMDNANEFDGPVRQILLSPFVPGRPTSWLLK